MSYRVISCHVVSCHVVSCVSCRVMSKGVSPFRVVSCRVLPRPVVSMWWSPNGVCAQAFFCQRIMSVTQPRTVIRLRTARPPHIFSSSRCLKKKATPRLFLRRDWADPEGSNEQRPGARSTQADVRVYHHETAVRAVRVPVLPVKKTSLHMGRSDSAANHRTSVEKTNSRGVKSRGSSKECQDPQKDTDLLVLVN